MNEKESDFGYFRSLAIDYSVEQIEASLNHLKSLKQTSSLAADNTPEQAIDDALNRLSRVLEILRKLKGIDDIVLELKNLIEPHDS